MNELDQEILFPLKCQFVLNAFLGTILKLFILIFPQKEYILVRFFQKFE